jgi:pimeloyl-ACP methyl ester carboxylesterase
VVFLPGGVLPADPAYAALLQVLGERVDAAVKDLEVYSGDRPAADYGLGTEVEGIVREADAHGFDRFHLVGYSGGGASSLAFAAVHGYRLLSLALLEPAWAGNEKTAEEEGLMQRFRALEPLPPDQFMAGFVGLQLAPGVEPPPPLEGPPPPWMAKRPAGLRAILQAFDSGDLDVDVLRAFDRPVYFALGGRSNPDYYGRMANRLAAIFPDFTIEIFPERHHFDPPHRIEPDRLAGSLLALSAASRLRRRPWVAAKPVPRVELQESPRSDHGGQLPSCPHRTQATFGDRRGGTGDDETEDLSRIVRSSGPCHARGVDRLIGRGETRFQGDGLNWGAADTASTMASKSSLAEVVTPTHRCSGHPPVGTQRI